MGRHVLPIFLLMAAATWNGAAQIQPRPRGDSRPQSRRPLGEFDARRRLVMRVVDDLGPEDRRELDRLAPDERDHRIAQLADRRRESDEQAFVATLNEADRASLDALADRPQLHRARLIELRVTGLFEKVLEDARTRGIVDASEAGRLASLSLTAKAGKTLELQRTMFLADSKDVWKTLPEDLRQDLESLPPAEFFDHPEVRKFKRFRFLAPPEFERLRQIDEKAGMRLIDALDAGRVADEGDLVLTKERAAALRKLPREDQRRLAHDLRRMFDHAADGPGRGQEGAEPGPEGGAPPGPEGAGPPGGPLRPGIGPERFRPPPSLLEELSPQEQRMALNLPGRERIAFFVRRFGPARIGEALRHDFAQMMPPELRKAFDDLPATERERLTKLTPPRAIAELFRTHPELRPRNGGGTEPRPGDGRGPGPGNGPPRRREGPEGPPNGPGDRRHPGADGEGAPPRPPESRPGRADEV